MSREIFLIQNDDQIIAMREQAYDSEALLQDWLARYPHLLVGEQIDPHSHAGGSSSPVKPACLPRKVEAAVGRLTISFSTSMRSRRLWR